MSVSSFLAPRNYQIADSGIAPLSAFAARRKAQAGAEASDGSATVHVNSLTLSPSTIPPTNDSVGPELPQTCVDSPESGPSDEVLVTPQAQTPSLPINEVVVLLGVCPEGVQLNKSAVNRSRDRSTGLR